MYQTCKKEGAPSLPSNDMTAERRVFVTPASHRIMTKRFTLIDEKLKLIIEKSRHVVIMRPKFFCGSSGTSWANETVRLRHIMPEEFEVPFDYKFPDPNEHVSCPHEQEEKRLAYPPFIGTGVHKCDNLITTFFLFIISAL
eukprot:Lithocolla_globosa_v1_NODE_825_length_3226_cov_19.169032.p2 type:complete len:141 gc:universal NODE_825_length_3226_cov_19.169032:2209-2631(+)